MVKAVAFTVCACVFIEFSLGVKKPRARACMSAGHVCVNIHAGSGVVFQHVTQTFAVLLVFNSP